MADAPSITTFVMGQQLPWPDDASPADDRGPFDAAVIHDCGVRQDCSIRRISALGATVRAKIASEPDQDIAIELANGQRPTARVEWLRDGENGLRFHQPIDVIALINRKLVSQLADRRAMPRVEIRCGAYVKCGEDFLPATVRNISARGLQLEGSGLPEVGRYVSLFVEGLSVPAGEVAWRKDRLAGIELMEELSWAGILPWIREQLKSEAH